MGSTVNCVNIDHLVTGYTQVSWLKNISFHGDVKNSVLRLLFKFSVVFLESKDGTGHAQFIHSFLLLMEHLETYVYTPLSRFQSLLVLWVCDTVF